MSLEGLWSIGSDHVFAVVIYMSLFHLVDLKFLHSSKERTQCLFVCVSGSLWLCSILIKDIFPAFSCQLNEAYNWVGLIWTLACDIADYFWWTTGFLIFVIDVIDLVYFAEWNFFVRQSRIIVFKVNFLAETSKHFLFAITLTFFDIVCNSFKTFLFWPLRTRLIVLHKYSTSRLWLTLEDWLKY